MPTESTVQPPRRLPLLLTRPAGSAGLRSSLEFTSGLTRAASERIAEQCITWEVLCVEDGGVLRFTPAARPVLEGPRVSSFWRQLGAVSAPASEEDAAERVFRFVHAKIERERDDALVVRVAGLFELDDFDRHPAAGAALLAAMLPYEQLDDARRSLGARLRARFEVDDFGTRWIANLMA